MTSIDVNGLLDRFVAIELEAFATISQAVDSVPYFYHQQSSFPYLTHRIVNLDLQYDDEDYTRNLYTVETRLIIGHIGEGYIGENEDRLYTWIPLLVTYFQQRRLLQSATYPTVLNGLVGAEMQNGANTGWTGFQDGGFSGIRVGTRFLTVCQFSETIEQAY